LAHGLGSRGRPRVTLSGEDVGRLEAYREVVIRVRKRRDFSPRAASIIESLAMDLDREACYRAVKARDRAFDGRFLTGVLSTGIFCRPLCPARTPRFENCIFFPTAAAAYSAGFRPCLRCRPEISPGVPAWSGTAATVNRALRLIAEEGPEVTNLEALASRLGVGSRHLRRRRSTVRSASSPRKDRRSRTSRHSRRGSASGAGTCGVFSDGT